MPKKYIVQLSDNERTQLQEIVSKGRVLARKRQHAQILLKADESPGAPAWIDSKIAEAFDVSVCTIERVRQRLVEHGLEDALEHRTNPRGAQRRRKLDGEGEARLVQIACSEPPEGHARWSLRLLAERLIELEIVDTISHEAVRSNLKKTNSSLG